MRRRRFARGSVYACRIGASKPARVGNEVVRTRTRGNVISPVCGPELESRRAAQLPERPSKRLQQFHIQGAIYGPPHQGPISRPHPHREPVLIGAPLELLADPTRWTSHRCRHRSYISVFGALLCVRASYARCSSFPQVRREAVELSLSGTKLVGIDVIGPALPKGSRRLTHLADDPRCYWQPLRRRLPGRGVLVSRSYFPSLRQVADTSPPRFEGNHPNPCLALRARPLPDGSGRQG